MNHEQLATTATPAYRPPVAAIAKPLLIGNSAPIRSNVWRPPTPVC
jgi:hypothetical protein